MEFDAQLPLEAVRHVIVEEGLGQAVESEIASDQIEDETLQGLWAAAKEALGAIGAYIDEQLGAGPVWIEDSEDDGADEDLDSENIPDPEGYYEDHGETIEGNPSKTGNCG